MKKSTTLYELSEEFGISREKIRLIEAKAIRKMSQRIQIKTIV